MKKLSIAILMVMASAISAHAQISRLGQDIEYRGEMSTTLGSGDYAPLWHTANRYGLGTTENCSGYLRMAVERHVETDSLHDWRFGYGADVVVPVNYGNHVILQQLYADVRWRMLGLSIGQQERPLELKNQLLSSGAMTSGINARPLPQVRVGMPEFWAVPRTRGCFSIKGHVAYGWYTDNGWQRDFNGGDTRYIYSANSLYHTKEFLFRAGNHELFPLTFTCGIELSCQFGGEAWNLRDRGDHEGPWDPHQHMAGGAKAYWNAFVPGGSDANDGDYANVGGNQLGSWHFRFDYAGKGWSVGAYAEHFFDDHSQMFFQGGPVRVDHAAGWTDMLYGVEVNLPTNRVVSTLVYEYLNTMKQSGAVYHDKTTLMPIQVSGMDNYYNHHLYGAWQHAGFTMGTPLLPSPMYNGNRNIYCYDNRVRAHHIGLSGQPHRDASYRVLYTHEYALGTYDAPRAEPARGHFLLLEATYRPHQVSGLGITASYAQNAGELLGHSRGAMLSVSYSGWLNKKK